MNNKITKKVLNEAYSKNRNQTKKIQNRQKILENTVITEK